MAIALNHIAGNFVEPFMCHHHTTDGCLRQVTRQFGDTALHAGPADRPNIDTDPAGTLPQLRTTLPDGSEQAAVTGAQIHDREVAGTAQVLVSGAHHLAESLCEQHACGGGEVMRRVMSSPELT